MGVCRKCGKKTRWIKGVDVIDQLIPGHICLIAYLMFPNGDETFTPSNRDVGYMPHWALCKEGTFPFKGRTLDAISAHIPIPKWST